MCTENEDRKHELEAILGELAEILDRLSAEQDFNTWSGYDETVRARLINYMKATNHPRFKEAIVVKFTPKPLNS